jgi:hypothetical protein
MVNSCPVVNHMYIILPFKSYPRYINKALLAYDICDLLQLKLIITENVFAPTLAAQVQQRICSFYVPKYIYK